MNIQISKNGRSIKIIPENKKEFKSKPQNQIFLEMYGFLEKSGIFSKSTDDPLELIEVLRKKFSKNHSIEYNDEIKEIFEERENKKNKFQEYKKIGIKTKNSKNKKIKLSGLKKGFKLKPYQINSVQHLISIPNTANFSIPGAGKTIMTYAGYLFLKEKNDVDQLWVIGPRASFIAWKTEFTFLTNREVKSNITVYHGMEKKERHKNLKKASMKKYDVVLTTYETATNDLNELSKYFRTSGKEIFLVLDESHRIKNIDEESESSKLTRSESMIRLGKWAKRRCILTGTPLPHEWDDLWSQITFLWPDNSPFGSRKNFLRMIEDEDFKRIEDIMDFTWSRVTNKQVEKDLPERRVKYHTCKMGKDQERIYEIIENQVAGNLTHESAKQKVRAWKRARIIRLMQVVTNPNLLLESDPVFKIQLPELEGKNKEDQEILKAFKKYSNKQIPTKILEVEKLARKLSKAKKNVIIFTHFRGNVAILASLLKDRCPIPITGENDSAEQEKRIDMFKNGKLKSGEGKILVATAGTLAESVSLHKDKNDKPVCQDVIFLERSYDAGKYMQALHRVYRIGSPKKLPINYHIFLSEYSDGRDTLDQAIDQALKTRLRRLYNLMKDIFKVVSLNTKKIKGEEQQYTEGDNVEEIQDDIIKKLATSKNKQKKKSKLSKSGVRVKDGTLF